MSEIHPLANVVERVKEYTKNNISSSVIFDLDGTVFDNRTRTAFILREIAEKFEKKVPALKNIVDRFNDLSLFRYDLSETLANFDITGELEIEFIRKEWEKRFFADNSQLLDVPLSGAKRYVDRIHAAGATIIYLTGRDIERMLVGTTESLRQFGFPVGIIGTMIIQKQDFNESDEFFKVNTVNYIKRLGKVVAIFENEPNNINLLKHHFPESDCFLVKTQHRPDAPNLEVDSFEIDNFRY
ncbi:hypothetical protein JXR93_01295 [bacterium]|nr:hypothetical protein [bacterium]